MSVNYPYELRPRKWADVKFQEAAVTTIRSWVAKSRLPSFMFITGSTGTGKTCITKLLVQTVHCLDRAVGSADNCGSCAVCQSDPQLTSGYANVVWVAAESAKDGDGKEITYQRSIIEALHAADRGPVTTGHPHRDVLFIVFEEAHLMPKDLFQRCLARADSVNPFTGNVVLVFLTMSPEEMPARARQAISQRGAILNLNTPSQLQIVELLQQQFNLDAESSLLLAEASEGSIRGAYSAYKDCWDFDPNLSIESIQAKLRYSVRADRQVIWEAIGKKLSPAEFKRVTTTLINNCDKGVLVKLLQADLDESYNILGESLWWTATKLIGQYSYNPKGISLTYLLLNLRALDWPTKFYQQHHDKSNSIIRRLLTETWDDLRIKC